MIKRDKYLKLLIDNKDNGFPKVITGIRRCGKSYLLKEIFKAYLIEQSIPEENILIVELDDDKNIMEQFLITLDDFDLNYGEVNYSMSVSGLFSGDGKTRVVSNLGENLAPMGSVISTPSISGFTETVSIQDAVQGRVNLLYDVVIEVTDVTDNAYTREGATFVGTMNE